MEEERDTSTIKQEPDTSGDNVYPTHHQTSLRDGSPIREGPLDCGALPNADQIRCQVGVGGECSQTPGPSEKGPVQLDMETLIRHIVSGEGYPPSEAAIFKSSIFKEAQQLISQNCVFETFIKAACEDMKAHDDDVHEATVTAPSWFAEANLMMELKNEVKVVTSLSSAF